MSGYITAGTAADIVGRDSRSIIKRIPADEWIADAEGRLVTRLWRRETIEANAERIRAEAVRGVHGHMQQVGTTQTGKPVIRVEPEPEPEPAPDQTPAVAALPPAPVAEPAEDRPAGPVTLLGLLRGLAQDGAIPLPAVTEHAREFADKLGLEPVQFTSEIHKLHASGVLKIGVNVRNGVTAPVYRIDERAAA